MTREVDPDPLHKRTRDASRRDLEMLDDTPREDAGDVAEIGDGIREKLND